MLQYLFEWRCWTEQDCHVVCSMAHFTPVCFLNKSGQHIPQHPRRNANQISDVLYIQTSLASGCVCDTAPVTVKVLQQWCCRTSVTGPSGVSPPSSLPPGTSWGWSGTLCAPSWSSFHAGASPSATARWTSPCRSECTWQRSTRWSSFLGTLPWSCSSHCSSSAKQKIIQSYNEFLVSIWLQKVNVTKLSLYFFKRSTVTLPWSCPVLFIEI